MPRAKGGFKTRRRRKRVLKLAEGYWGAKSKLFRTATEAVDKALKYAYRDRRVKKRNFRQLWIARINAATVANGLSYSRFIAGLKKADITLNRKTLSELAISDPTGFAKIVEAAKAQFTEKAA
ncbi:MAG: 50S ribosomal protein L20 [Nitrospirae bacterium]|nr:50S ribosomal protein L20 [Nitrospirota bacterium]